MVTREGHIWGVEFYDVNDNKVEEHRMFHLGAGRWNTWNFSQGEKSKYGWIGRGKGDLKRIVRIGFRAQTRAGGQTAEALWDDFRIISPVVTEKIRRAANVSDTPPTVSTGETAVWLDASNGYSLQGMRLAGRWLDFLVFRPQSRHQLRRVPGQLRGALAVEHAQSKPSGPPV